MYSSKGLSSTWRLLQVQVQKDIMVLQCVGRHRFFVYVNRKLMYCVRLCLCLSVSLLFFTGSWKVSSCLARGQTRRHAIDMQEVANVSNWLSASWPHRELSLFLSSPWFSYSCPPCFTSLLSHFLFLPLRSDGVSQAATLFILHGNCFDNVSSTTLAVLRFEDFCKGQVFGVWQP